MYFFLPPFSTNYSSVLSHFILPSTSWSTSQPCCSQIHIFFGGGILFSSILCTCRNQRNWYYNNIVYILMYLVSHTLCIKTVIGIIHSFIHSIGMCRMRRFLAVLRSFFHSSLLFTFPCHPFPPTILRSSLTSSCHLFLGLPLNLVVSDFIYNTLLGILFSSTLCTCPNQHNLFNLIVSITVGFVTLG